MPDYLETCLAAKSFFRPECGEKGTSCWVLVDCGEGRHFQVKFQNANTRNNINEFVGHFIASCIGAPVPEGRFIRFTRKMLEEIGTKMDFPLSRTMMPSDIYFGTRWHYGEIRCGDMDELRTQLDVVMNLEEFFSVFSLDQYLRNHDRHLGNNLVHIDGERKNRRFYKAIDFDRIMGGNDWSGITREKGRYSCFDTWVESLYDFVSDADFNRVLFYASRIGALSDKQLELLGRMLGFIYSMEADEYNKIMDFLRERVAYFPDVCLENQSCYPAVEPRLGKERNSG